MLQGTETKTQSTSFLDGAISSNAPVDFLQPQCPSTSQFSIPLQLGSATMQKGIPFYFSMNLPLDFEFNFVYVCGTWSF